MKKTRASSRRLLAAIAALLLALGCASALGEGASGQITFSQDGAEAVGEGVAVSGATVTISVGGVYQVSGVCPEGQIIVLTPKNAEVELVLNGLSLSCSAGPVVWATTDLLTLTLAPGSQNALRDSEDRTVPSSEYILISEVLGFVYVFILEVGIVLL